jgi:trans-aconitate 2-methyltransferase
MWDAEQYLKYADERSRPFADLLARVNCDSPKLIADLGCGPGHLTRTLAERWPAARVIGVDNSTAMLKQAAAIPGRLEFVHADLAAWNPGQPLDLIVSNAAFQWVAGHEALLSHLASLLAPAGTLAVQMPYHFNNPAHLVIEATKTDARWRNVLGDVGLTQQSVKPLVWYVERLHDLGFAVDAWETTYLHVLTGANPVLEWFKGSALRPLLDKLDAQVQDEFLADVGARLLAAYPARNGVTLLPFPRLFFVATRGR